MNSLTETILHANQAKNRKGRGEDVDELGLPKKDAYGNDVTNTVDYMVARTLIRDAKRVDFEIDTVHRLHMRTDQIFRGNEQIIENTENFHLLTGLADNTTRGKKALFWEGLKSHLPKLYPNIIKVGEDVYWNKKTGELLEASYEDLIKREGL